MEIRCLRGEKYWRLCLDSQRWKFFRWQVGVTASVYRRTKNLRGVSESENKMERLEFTDRHLFSYGQRVWEYIVDVFMKN